MRASRLAALVLALAAVVPATASAISPQERQLTARCAFCHGPTGVAQSPIWPSLAGLDASYLEARMASFMAGTDKHPSALQMRYVLRGKTPAELRALAAFYARQLPPPPRGTGTAAAAQLYAGGDGKAILACASCHGVSGEGDKALLAPRLAGQSAHYIISQLNAYANGQRPDRDSSMAAQARALSAQQRQALASYLQSIGSPVRGK